MKLGILNGQFCYCLRLEQQAVKGRCGVFLHVRQNVGIEAEGDGH